MSVEYHTIQLGEAAPAQSGSNYGGYTSGDEILVWYDRSQRCWCACFQGVSSDGNAYEGDDVDGFKSKQEAIDYMISVSQQDDPMLTTWEDDYNY